MIRTPRYVTFAAAMLAAPMVLAGGASGQAIGFTCAGCHGTDGDSQGVAPSLRGQEAEYLRTALMEFKSGKRQATIMDRIAKGYTDEEIEAVAKYFANLK